MLLAVLAFSILSLCASSLAARLVDFQVAQPLILPSDARECTIKILE